MSAQAVDIIMFLGLSCKVTTTVTHHLVVDIIRHHVLRLTFMFCSGVREDRGSTTHHVGTGCSHHHVLGVELHVLDGAWVVAGQDGNLGSCLCAPAVYLAVCRTCTCKQAHDRVHPNRYIHQQAHEPAHPNRYVTLYIPTGTYTCIHQLAHEPAHPNRYMTLYTPTGTYTCIHNRYMNLHTKTGT